MSFSSRPPSVLLCLQYQQEGATQSPNSPFGGQQIFQGGQWIRARHLSSIRITCNCMNVYTLYSVLLDPNFATRALLLKQDGTSLKPLHFGLNVSMLNFSLQATSSVFFYFIVRPQEMLLGRPLTLIIPLT